MERAHHIQLIVGANGIWIRVAQWHYVFLGSLRDHQEAIDTGHKLAKLLTCSVSVSTHPPRTIEGRGQVREA